MTKSSDAISALRGLLTDESVRRHVSGKLRSDDFLVVSDGAVLPSGEAAGLYVPVAASPEEEVEVWDAMAEFHSRVSGKCALTGHDRVANPWERYRRHCHRVVFRAFSFTAPDGAEAPFKACVGEQTLIDYLRCRPPERYLDWFYDAAWRPSLRTFGKKSMAALLDAGGYDGFLRRRFGKARVDSLVIKSVMSS